MNRAIIMIIFTGLVTYLARVIPLLLYRGKEPSKFVRSFLEYIPYSALAAILFPEILYSTDSMLTAALGGSCATILIIKKQNMIITVAGTILLVYILNLSI
ncbi:branched-chain amino acid transport [Orenia metallireducens]|uniref:Branched-chain amino acid transport n=2 Tax=Orenia metallireducens TaxID=1413210 RepID=A0A1C0ACY7_9FIRM|nr:branched-chain amino acid transport [Orenia metallireducens]